MNLEILENNIKYKFKDKSLLKNALTHTSYAYEHNVASNEKLEFLGDSILEFVSSEYMYNKYTNLKEGELTKVRATVVCEKSLHKVALANDFGDFLYLGKSEVVTGGNKRPAILADSVEAVIKETWPDHDKKFDAEVCFNGKVLATGIGSSKKSAEMEAAKKALGE